MMVRMALMDVVVNCVAMVLGGFDLVDGSAEWQKRKWTDTSVAGLARQVINSDPLIC